MRCSWIVAAAALLCPRLAAADPCLEAARAEFQSWHDTVGYYWDGKKLEPLGGATAKQQHVYFVVDPAHAEGIAKRLPKSLRPKGLGDLKRGDPKPVVDPAGCAALFSVLFEPKKAEPNGTTAKPAGQSEAQVIVIGPETLDKVLQGYRVRAIPRGSFGGDSAATIAAEAAQILGQIVVDRASQAAYALLSSKVRTWLWCDDKDAVKKAHFARTCAALKGLRLQDLAMTPSVLGATLAEDVMKLLPVARKSGQRTASRAMDLRSALAEAAPPPAKADGRQRATRDVESARDTTEASAQADVPDAIEVLDASIRRAVVPLLSRRVGALAGREAEAIAVALVERGLRWLRSGSGKLSDELCNLEARKQVLATAAVAFAACQVATAPNCSIAQVVTSIDAACPAPLEPGQLAHALSIASHLQDAISLGRDGEADPPGRLAAAAEAAFDIACLFSHDDKASAYSCEIDDSKHGDDLSDAEKVAVVREVVRAAIDQNGPALALAVTRALARCLPAGDDASARRGLRVLATVTAYASTYTTSELEAKGAHERRTELLESLTRDMTDRTERDGDTIASIGGSLRLVGGSRLGQTRDDGWLTKEGDHPEAFWGPVSLPLGFGLDFLGEERKGWHLEISVVDLGHYLHWDDGGEVATPELSDAFAPAVTFGRFWGREIPFFVGLSIGYSPAFDFDPDSEADRRGAFNVGGTIGAYVPLLDFN
jgi:hypothetical protein